jgi:hypothetical protein
MITPLTIISLDQGKALARRHVEKLHDEPAEPAPQFVDEEVAIIDDTPAVQAQRRERQSLVGRFLSFWDAALPIGAWRI